MTATNRDAGMDARGRRNAGIICICSAVFLLALSDALVKNAGGSLALAQLVFLRSLIAIVIMVVMTALLAQEERLSLKRRGWVWARNLCLAGMWLCYYAGLPFMSFSLAAACYYTAPVWMALLSRIILGERIGIVKLIAIVTAFVGVVVAVDPFGSELSLAVLLPLAAALFYALTAIITWSRCADESPLALAFNLNIILVIAGSVGITILALFAPVDADGFILSAWPSLGTKEWLLIVFLALLHPVIEMAVARAYQLAPSTIIGVFDNAYLPFAALWAFVLLLETPTWGEASGMALIGAAGVLIVREGHRQPE